MKKNKWIQAAQSQNKQIEDYRNFHKDKCTSSPKSPENKSQPSSEDSSSSRIRDIEFAIWKIESLERQLLAKTEQINNLNELLISTKVPTEKSVVMKNPQALSWPERHFPKENDLILTSSVFCYNVTNGCYDLDHEWSEAYLIQYLRSSSGKIYAEEIGDNGYYRLPPRKKFQMVTVKIFLQDNENTVITTNMGKGLNLADLYHFVQCYLQTKKHFSLDFRTTDVLIWMTVLATFGPTLNVYLNWTPQQAKREEDKKPSIMTNRPLRKDAMCKRICDTYIQIVNKRRNKDWRESNKWKAEHRKKNLLPAPVEEIDITKLEKIREHFGIPVLHRITIPDYRHNLGCFRHVPIDIMKIIFCFMTDPFSFMYLRWTCKMMYCVVDFAILDLMEPLHRPFVNFSQWIAIDFGCKTKWSDISLMQVEKLCIQQYLKSNTRLMPLQSRPYKVGLYQKPWSLAKTILVEATKDSAPRKFAEAIAAERNIPLLLFRPSAFTKVETNVWALDDVRNLLSWIGPCVLFIDLLYASKASYWNNFVKRLPENVIMMGVVPSVPKDHCFEFSFYLPPPGTERMLSILMQELGNFPIKGEESGKDSMSVLEKIARKFSAIGCCYEMDIRATCKKAITYAINEQVIENSEYVEGTPVVITEDYFNRACLSHFPEERQNMYKMHSKEFRDCTPSCRGPMDPKTVEGRKKIYSMWSRPY